MITVDAKDMIIGRLSSYLAQIALKGETINVINIEHAIITGKKETVIAKWKKRDNRGEPFHGPFIPKTPTRMAKRIIRNMLPMTRTRGRDALKRIKYYIGNKSNQSVEILDQCHIKHSKTFKYITLGEVCKALKK